MSAKHVHRLYCNCKVSPGNAWMPFWLLMLNCSNPGQTRLHSTGGLPEQLVWRLVITAATPKQITGSKAIVCLDTAPDR